MWDFIKEYFRPNWRVALVWAIVFVTIPIWFPLIYVGLAWLFVFSVYAITGITIATLNVLVWVAGIK